MKDLEVKMEEERLKYLGEIEERQKKIQEK